MLFIILPIAIVGLFLLVALSRSATVDSARIGSRKLTIQTPVAPALVFSHALQARAPFHVADSHEPTLRLVLTTKPTFATWGFYYPIEIHPGPSGGSHIHIGIKSRLIQFGPLVTRWHDKCQDEITQLLGSLPQAHVVAGG